MSSFWEQFPLIDSLQCFFISIKYIVFSYVHSFWIRLSLNPYSAIHFYSVTQLCPMSNCLQAHGLQHARLPCPSPAPGAYSNSCLLSWWRHATVICCCLLLLPHSIFPSIRVFSSESVLCMRWPKYWSFSFNVSPSNEYSGLISFRMDWLGVLAVQRTLKSLLQHHSSKALISRCSAFFISNSHIHTWLLEKS